VYYLDRAFRAAMVAVELDGADHHTKPADRERDLRRDAELATLGWLTVRFTAARLRADPAGVLDELLAILEVRAIQLGAVA
jgi:very-short-patch-repair endonuclease